MTDPLSDVPDLVRAFGIDACYQWRDWRHYMIRAGMSVERAEEEATNHCKLCFDPAMKDNT